MSLFPANSEVVERSFGKDCSFDMIGISNEVILDENDLIFTFQPITNFETTYDYSVSQIGKSLNTYAYGLRKRI
jgi:hypothetical protein